MFFFIDILFRCSSFRNITIIIVDIAIRWRWRGCVGRSWWFVEHISTNTLCLERRWQKPNSNKLFNWKTKLTNLLRTWPSLRWVHRQADTSISMQVEQDACDRSSRSTLATKLFKSINNDNNKIILRKYLFEITTRWRAFHTIEELHRRFKLTASTKKNLNRLLNKKMTYFFFTLQLQCAVWRSVAWRCFASQLHHLLLTYNTKNKSFVFEKQFE